MKKDGELPMIDDIATGLGVKVGDAASDDIWVDGKGEVHPGAQGLSVAPTLRDLAPHRIPKRLRDQIPSAIGSNSCFVWRHGEGLFSGGTVAKGLELRVNDYTHGVVAPATTMLISQYKDAIRRTQASWVIDER